MIGIDLIEIERIKKSMDSQGFCARVYTPEELKYINSRGVHSFESAAGIFAAKEALIKALGTAVPLGEIGVLHKESGAPVLVLAGRALHTLAERTACVSITHTAKYAAAVVMLEEKK